ncbi:MAG: hypothetical protein K6F30_07765 [Lachnospiraceae bacterium]|nr:hypothetical protein [Lachnospiraceae bacterium]
MSKIYKWQYITQDEEEQIIDSNDLIREKLEVYERKLQKEKDLRNAKLKDDFYASITQDEEGNVILPMDEEGNILFPFDEDGNQLVIIDEEGNIIDAPISEEGEEESSSVSSSILLEEAEEEAEKIKHDARFAADMILSEAQDQAEALKSHHEEEGKKLGYQEGIAQAMQEYNAKEADLEAENERIKAEYRLKQEALESEIVNSVCDLLEKFFCVQFGDSKELLLHLVDNCLLNIENSKQFLIKSNEQGYDFLQENKALLQEKVGNDAVLDIVKDPVLLEGQCIIETDGGVFDCSLDTEMKNLIKDLRSLSV